MQFQPNPVSRYRPASRCAFHNFRPNMHPVAAHASRRQFHNFRPNMHPVAAHASRRPFRNFRPNLYPVTAPASGRPFRNFIPDMHPVAALPADGRFIIMGKTVLRSSVCRQDGCLPYRRGQPVLSLHMRRLKRMWRLGATSRNNMSRMRRLIFGNAAQPYLVPVEPKPPRSLDLRASTSINSISGCFFIMRN